MGLNKEEIQFIDNYLDQAGMRYIDMRLEWVDHIATSIEAEIEKEESLSFYDAFKAFMVRHKKEILKTYEDQKQKVGNAVLLRFGKGFLKLDVLLIIVMLMVILSGVEVLPFINGYQEYLMLVPIVIALVYAALYLKGSKVSDTRGLLVLSTMSIHGFYYYSNPYVFFFVVALTVLIGGGINVVKKKYGEKKSFWFMGGVIFVSVQFIIPFNNWSKAFIGDGVRIIFFCMQLLFVYVLAKTAIQTLNKIRLKRKRISLIQ